MRPPLISIIIPTYNEEKRIAGCLDSIFSQTYSRHCLQVIAVDDFSTDQTRRILKRYGIQILDNGEKDPDYGKMLGLRQAAGEFFCWFDADFILKGKDWFEKMIRPFLEEAEVAASITRYYPHNRDKAINRYLNFDSSQRDPVYINFSPDILETVKERREGYYLCEFELDKVPPMAGGCIYKRETLFPLVKGYKRFLDIDSLVMLVEKGFNKFAYVPEAGIYHFHADSLAELCYKRLRNVQKCYLENIEFKKYKWFEISKKKDLLKIILWILYAHSIVFPLARGVYRSIRHRDIAGLYEPLACLMLTDIIIFGFISQRKGRQFIFEGLKRLITSGVKQ